MKKGLKNFFKGSVSSKSEKCSPDVADSFELDPVGSQTRLLSGLDKSAVTIFDVGANKGQSAEKYRAAFPAADIYCFEPFPESAQELKNHFSGDSKVHVVEKAVAREKGVATFYVNAFDATNSLLPRTDSERRYYPKTAGPKDTIEVEVTSIDSFMAECGLTGIDILKLDLQGGELDALRGAEKLLGNVGASLIYSEIMFVPHYKSAPLFYEIWDFLEKYGYSLFDIYDLHKATNGQLRYGDALFVSDFVRKNVIDTFTEEP